MISIENLYEIFQKYPKVFTDSRLAGQGGIYFALKGDKFDGNDFVESSLANGANYAVTDRRTISSDERIVFVDDVLSTLQKLVNFHRRKLQIPVLAITGTNGKTTTKELVTHVLSTKYKVLSTEGNLNNHIGVPLTLLKITSEHEFAVIEMGANHPGEIEFLCRIAEPDYGIITNVGMAHLEGFGSFEGVKKTKGELYNHILKSGKGIFINSANPHLLGMAPDSIEKYTYAISEEDAELTGEVAGNTIKLVCRILFSKGWLYIKTHLTGAYNLENVLAASRIGLKFGIDPLEIQKGIENYIPSNNRSQVIRLKNTAIIADCYNANPSSMAASINNFKQIEQENKTLVLGDMLELGNDSKAEHQKIVNLVVSYNMKDVFWVGKNFFHSDLPGDSLRFENVDELISNIKKEIFDGKIVLIKGSRGIKLEKLLDFIVEK